MPPCYLDSRGLWQTPCRHAPNCPGWSPGTGLVQRWEQCQKQRRVKSLWGDGRRIIDNSTTFPRGWLSGMHAAGNFRLNGVFKAGAEAPRDAVLHGMSGDRQSRTSKCKGRHTWRLTRRRANRRDFHRDRGTGFPGVGAGVTLWPFIQQMKPGRVHPGAGSTGSICRPSRKGRRSRWCGRGKPGLHPQPARPRDQEGGRRQAVGAIRHQRAQRRSAGKRRGHHPNRTKKGHENWIRSRRHLHDLGCIPKGQGLSDARVNFGAGSALSTARTTTRRAAYRQGPAPRNLEVRPTRSRPTPRSRSAEDLTPMATHESPIGRLEHRQVDGRASACRRA